MGPGAGAPFIVVGLDDSAPARTALRWAAREARLIGAVVNAVHVLDGDIGIAAFGSPTRVHNDFVAESAVVFSYRRGIRRSFEAILPPPDWRLQFAEGEVGPVLVRAAQGAAMLVIGYRPWRGSDSDLADPVVHYLPQSSAMSGGCPARWALGRGDAPRVHLSPPTIDAGACNHADLRSSAATGTGIWVRVLRPHGPVAIRPFPDPPLVVSTGTVSSRSREKAGVA